MGRRNRRRGYFHSLYPPERKEGLPFISSLLGLSHFGESLPGSESASVFPNDTVLVSVDFENIQALKPCTISPACTQMGVAIFDPWLSRDESPGFGVLQSIQTYNFATGNPEYLDRASRKYLFGETIFCDPSDFLAYLRAVLPCDRPFIIIGHTVAADRNALIKLRFQPSPLLLGFVDTHRLSGEVFNAPGGFGSLRKTLTELRCPHNGLHCAGNDAHFTLRAFLLLAERGFLNRCAAPLSQDATILSRIRRVAMAPVPRPTPTRVKKPPGIKSQAEMKSREKVLHQKTAFRADRARTEAEVDEEGYAGGACWLF